MGTNRGPGDRIAAHAGGLPRPSRAIRSPRLRREGVRFAKFTVVGAIGFLIDFGTFNALTVLLAVWSVLASALSFIAALASNFLWNRYWTYPDSRSKPVLRQLVQFALVNLVGLAIRTPIFAFSEGPFIHLAGRLLAEGPLPFNLPLDSVVLGRNLALALAVVVVLFWNFGANRIWTYSDAP